MNKELLVVLILFHIKHYFGDFVLQSNYMLGKGKGGVAWILPLSAHCAVHAILSLFIILVVTPSLFWLVGLEFIAHFLIDKLKVSYKLPSGDWGANKGKYLNQYYMAFGLDQLAHQLCYVVMAYAMYV
jgi:Protein of unknown function (DUF3307)